MSDLTRFRDHCRDMATAEHKPECVEQLRRWEERARVVRWFDVPDPGSRPECPGCNTAADRALFAQLAGEVDAYLAPQVDLFGEETAEPTPPTAPETP